MPGAKQSDITKFFSPKTKDSKGPNPSKSIGDLNTVVKPSMKRKIEIDVEAVEENETDREKEKDQKGQTACQTLSPDQKKRMLINKSLAVIKVSSRRLPFALHENIGLTWFNALKDEFDKPYFTKLNNFLETERNSSVKIFPPHDQVNCNNTYVKITLASLSSDNCAAKPYSF